MPPPDRLISHLAATQEGYVSHAQLLALGLTREAIRHRVARGRLIRVHRGVYAVGFVNDAFLGRAHAAVLATNQSALVSHWPAAVIWDMLPPRNGPIHLTRISANARSRPGLLVHRSALLRPDRASRRGLDVTSPARTLLDLAETESGDTVERALGQAEIDRLITPQLLERALPRWVGRRGVAVLRDILDDGSAGLGGTRSWLETHFVPLLRKADLPLPKLNAEVHDVEVDALWRQQRVVVELDSRRYHHTSTRFEADRARDAFLASHGFVTLRFTHRRVTREPFAVIAELSAALRHRDLVAA